MPQKIKIQLSPIDRGFLWTGIITLILTWSLAIFYYTKLPGIIPIHYNALGHPDAFGKKPSIFILPVIGTIIFTLLQLLNRHPHVFNYPVPVTEKNALAQYTNSTRAIRCISTIIVVIFALIVLFTCLTATGGSKGLGSWFLPFILAFILLPTIYFVVKSYKVAK